MGRIQRERERDRPPFEPGVMSHTHSLPSVQPPHQMCSEVPKYLGTYLPRPRRGLRRRLNINVGTRGQMTYVSVVFGRGPAATLPHLPSPGRLICSCGGSKGGCECTEVSPGSIATA